MSKFRGGVGAVGTAAPIYLCALLCASTTACEDAENTPVPDGGSLSDATQVVPDDDGGALNNGGSQRPVEPPPNLPPPTTPATQSGVIVVVSHDLLISVSRDSGDTWTTVSHMPGLPENQMLLMRASFANGMYFATGWRFFSSADATVFSEVNLPTKQWFGDVVFSNGKYVSGGGWGSYVTSADGVNWVPGKLPGIDQNITSVASGGGRFAMSLADGTVYSSDDATTWVVDPALKTTNLAFCNGAFRNGVECQKPDLAASVWQGHGYWYFARWPDTLLRSTDGRNFKPIQTFPAGIRDMAFGGQP